MKPSRAPHARQSIDSVAIDSARALADLRGHLRDVFEGSGARLYGGERITQLAHALQSAHLAAQTGEDRALIIAALLHDYGHFFEADFDAALQGAADGRHEAIGARRLQRWFSPAVTEPIRLHVQAKRYLCAREARYDEGLSPASVHSLKLQGGPMSEQEALDFERLPYWQEAVRLRRVDDRAKEPGARTDSLESFLDLIERDLLAPIAC